MDPSFHLSISSIQLFNHLSIQLRINHARVCGVFAAVNVLRFCPGRLSCFARLVDLRYEEPCLSERSEAQAQRGVPCAGDLAVSTKLEDLI